MFLFYKPEIWKTEVCYHDSQSNSKIKTSLTFSTADPNLSVQTEVEQRITQTQTTNDK